VLELARDGVTADLLACLNDRDLVALTGYGARHAVIALRQGSATLLRDALLAEAICQVVRNGDDREVMVGLAVFYYVAQQLGLVPSDLFDEVTSCLPDGWIPDLLREFGARQDTLSRPSHGNWSRHLMGRTSCPPCRKLTDKRPKLPV